MRRLVEPVFIQDQGVGQGARLEQAVPVRRVARETRHLEPHHEARTPQADIAHELLKAFTVRGRRAGLAEVAVDDDNLMSVFTR